jgi:hypothetical protein
MSDEEFNIGIDIVKQTGREYFLNLSVCLVTEPASGIQGDAALLSITTEYFPYWLLDPSRHG